MCEYLTQIIHLGDREPVSPDGFRAVIGALSDKYDEPLPAGLFNRQQNGETLNHLPGVRFGGGKGIGRIDAVGDEAVDLLGAIGHRLTRMLGKDKGRVLREQRYSGEVTAERNERGRLHRYHCRRLYIAKSDGGGRSKRAQAARKRLVEKPDDTAAIVAMLEQRIRTGLERQAMTFDIDLPMDYLIGEITVAGVGPAPYAGKGTLGVVAKHVSFRSDLKLVGPWHVGYLQSRGYGAICAV